MPDFNFGDRKIVAMNYSRYVAIPKDWLRNNGLEAGDPVNISLSEDGNLKITRK